MGGFIQLNAGRVLVSGIIVLVVISFVGLKYSQMESKMERLWVEGKKEEGPWDFIPKRLILDPPPRDKSCLLDNSNN